jgi:tRNA nucleotidyltransferase (CCA-adding enzyme)
MIPSDDGPVDVTTFRGGPLLEDDLAHRDFTVNAIAYDPRRLEYVDPFDGRGDVMRRQLRAVRSASDRFSEDPLRALRAARLHATLGFDVDAEIEDAMADAREGLGRVARERVRRELSVLLLGPRAGDGLALLRRTGLDLDFAPGTHPDAAAVVDALPFDLELRLAGWLRGTRVGRILRQARFPRRVSTRVVHLLAQHPIEDGIDPARDVALRRMIKRVGADCVAPLIALRRAEIRVGNVKGEASVEDARKRLDELDAGVERVHSSGALALQRIDLAIDGRQVMTHLGCRPGPVVGRALAHLTDRVVDDPGCNTLEKLTEMLDTWWAEASQAD